MTYHVVKLPPELSHRDEADPRRLGQGRRIAQEYLDATVQIDADRALQKEPVRGCNTGPGEDFG